MDETAVEEFYDNHCHAHEPEETVDDRVIAGINAKTGAGIALSATDQKALKSDDPTPGIVWNPNKRWASHKELRGINII
jgi:hypothetical protein